MGNLSIEEQQEILDIHAQGMSVNSIAKATGRSNVAVTAVIRRGYAKPPRFKKWTDEEQKILEQMLAAGYHDRDIAERLNRPIQTVSDKRGQTLSRSKIQARVMKNHKWQDLIDQIDAQLEKGASYMVTIDNLKIKDNQWARPMTYEGKQPGANGVEFYMFRSSAGGWLEALTIQQINDRELKKVERRV